LRFAVDFLNPSAAELTILLLIFFMPVAAQDDPIMQSHWNAGVLTLKNETTLKGFIHHNEKFRSIRFREKLDDEEESNVGEGRILSMEYYDTNTSKNKKFFSWDVEEDGNTIQGAALYEVIMVTDNFIVLSRKFGVLPDTRMGKGKDTGNSKLEYDKIEKIFLAAEGGRGKLLWLGPVSEISELKSPVAQIAPFFDGDVLRKYTGSYWREVKSYIKKNRLKLKQRSDLVQVLNFYQGLERD
jgi:hypothetical protein